MMKHEREPIKHTCPDIDKALKSIYTVENLCKLTGRESEADLISLVDDIKRELWGTAELMESLRKSNDVLRSWGIAEAEEVDTLQLEIVANRQPPLKAPND